MEWVHVGERAVMDWAVLGTALFVLLVFIMGAILLALLTRE